MAALANADISHQILASVADFQTFLSLISTSKTFNAIFKAHPQSIIRDVAYNEVGAALPQALRLVRCEAARLRHMNVEELPKESDFVAKRIERGEVRMLAKNAKIAHTFEALFSWRCKDRTSRTSKLTNDESLRFQRALYRLWLYSAIYGFRPRSTFTDNNDRDPDEDGNEDDLIEDEDEGEDEDEDEDEDTNRQSFLDSFTTSHLDDMEKVASFLKDIATWVIRAHWRNAPSIGIIEFGDTVVYIGPRAILAQYESIASHITTSYFQILESRDGFFSNLLDLIREERGRGSQPSNDSDRVSIFNEVVGEYDRCQHCDARKGLQLWNETNWDYLLGVLNGNIHEYLPGRLPRNLQESVNLRDMLKNIGYSTFVKSLFGKKNVSFETWTEQDWICLDCLGEFIRHHLLAWWLDHRASTGTPEDCWYGYNCRTMTHNQVHAMKLNHLCVPTRGDP